MNKIWTPKIFLPSLLEADPRLAAARDALAPHFAMLSSAALECLFLPRIDVLPEHVLDLLAEQYHVDFYEPLGMSIDVKRDFIRNAILWHRFKGTPKAVETVLSRAFSIARVEEWFEYAGAEYFFRIHIDISSDDEHTDRDTLNRLRKAVVESKNARSWLEYYHFILDSADTVEHSDHQLIVVQPDLYDRYDYRRQAPAYDGSSVYDGSTVYGGFEAEDFEEPSLWFVGMSIADNASVSAQNALQAHLKPWHDTFIVEEGYALKTALNARDDVAVIEDLSAAVTLDVDEHVDHADSLRPALAVTISDSIGAADYANARLTQIFRYDGVLDYDGFADYGSTLAADNIFISDDDDRQRWVLLQAELERDFDEPCTCGASDYDWWYSSIRLGEERFLISDPQLVTVEIKCARCGYTLAEYIVPSADWEVLV